MSANATGAATSPDGLLKFNTANDKPNGAGVNEMMDQLQTVMNTKTAKPAGIVTGEVPVWNGTTWVRSSVTNIGASSLGSGTPDTTKFLRGDSSWQVPSMLVLDDLTVTGSVLASYDTNTRLGGVLPTTYKDMILVITGRSDQTGDQVLNLRINNDSTANYYYQRFVSNNAQAVSNEALAQTSFFGGAIPRNGGFFGNNTITFFNYAGTGNSVADGGYSVETTYMTAAATNGIVKYSAGGAHATINTTARIAVTPAVGSFQLGCRFTLYGRS